MRASLPRVDVEVLPPEVIEASLAAFERIGAEVSEVVERRPSSMVVVRTTRPRVVRKERERDAETSVLIAPPPELPIARGRSTSPTRERVAACSKRAVRAIRFSVEEMYVFAWDAFRKEHWAALEAAYDSLPGQLTSSEASSSLPGSTTGTAASSSEPATSRSAQSTTTRPGVMRCATRMSGGRPMASFVDLRVGANGVTAAFQRSHCIGCGHTSTGKFAPTLMKRIAVGLTGLLVLMFFALSIRAIVRPVEAAAAFGLPAEGFVRVHGSRNLAIAVMVAVFLVLKLV